MRKLLRFQREEHGATLVEFAMTAWVLLVLMLGAFQWMFAMYAYHFTTYAAQQATRFAMVRGATWSEDIATNCSTSSTNFTVPYACTASSTDIQNYVKSLATGGINPANITVNTNNWPGTTPDGTTTGCTAEANSKGCQVKVTVTYTFNFLPFVSKTAMSMSATSEKAILQ